MVQLLDNLCSVSWLPVITSITVGCLFPICYYKWSNNEEKTKMMKVVTTLLTMTAVPFLFVIIVFVLNNVCVVPNAKSAFKEGFPRQSVDCYVHRQDVIHAIQDGLRPPSHPGGYFLVEGQHGCGKTTVIEQAIAESGPGILYVPVDSEGDLSASLYKALKLDTYCNGYWAKLLHSYIKLPLNCPEESLARLKHALHILKAAASEIFKDNNYPPAIVFDNLSQVLKQPDGKQMIHLLQDTAKDISDKRYLILLFASSESAVPNIIRSRSSASRLLDTITVGDITDKQAADYLTCRCPKISKNTIAKAVSLVGGRFVDLIVAARIINTGYGDDLEERLLISGERFQQAQLAALPTQVLAALYKIAQSLLDSPSGTITLSAYSFLVNVLDVEDRGLIESTNSFWISQGKVWFHSRITKHYFKYLLSNSTTGHSAVKPL